MAANNTKDNQKLKRMNRERKPHLVSRKPTRESSSLLQVIDDAPFMNQKYCHNFLIFQFH